ncbi:hypothetical protein CLV51_11019 [Chitinophaga niastensis]|uniref:Phospholipase D-like protein n=1 Tax=Chitinophaga niastensis TaxID=536980 RepID=A0A2P8H994_CHINA|nr:hypothetical protein [Chitinophaga niastensis]PSL42803.1 hypothetical protein CLV51_11019 [Chitinophaga niastensis]
MKKLLFPLFVFISSFCFGQNNAGERKALLEPFKGAKKICLTFSFGADSLYAFVSKSLIKAGYAIVSRDKELGTIATDVKHIKFIDYKMNLVVDGSTVTITGQGNTGMGMTLGTAYVEPSWVDADYRSKADLRRKVFDDIIKFAESTHPDKIEYSK